MVCLGILLLRIEDDSFPSFMRPIRARRWEMTRNRYVYLWFKICIVALRTEA